MPTAALRPCSTCHELGCTQHRRRQDWDHEQPRTRIRGRKLQRLRNELFTRQPLCVLCLAQGRTSVAEIRDHIISLGEGGTDTDDNVQAICRACDKAKTHQETLRGHQRGRRGGMGGRRTV